MTVSSLIDRLSYTVYEAGKPQMSVLSDPVPTGIQRRSYVRAVLCLSLPRDLSLDLAAHAAAVEERRLYKYLKGFAMAKRCAADT
jgi:hypothetical protein